MGDLISWSNLIENLAGGPVSAQAGVKAAGGPGGWLMEASWSIEPSDTEGMYE